MQLEKMEEQYVALRTVQVFDDITNGVFEDYRRKTGLIDVTDDVFPFVVEMQDIYGKAEVLLEQHVKTQMCDDDITEAEKKVGAFLMDMSDKPQLGNFLHYVVNEIAKIHGVNWVKPGDVINCKHCGKKHIVGWDGSMMDLDDLSEEEIKNLQSGTPVIYLG